MTSGISMFEFRRALFAAAAIFGGVGAAALFASGANATTWSINESNGCGTGCTIGPFGTVEVTDDGAGTLSFNVQLLGTYNFMGGDNAFAFSLTGGPTISFSNFDPSDTVLPIVAPSFSAGNTVAADFSMDGFGKFMYGVDAAGSGGSSPNGQSLKFDITATGLDIGDLAVSTKGYLFAADICPLAGCGTGLTGYAAGGPIKPPGGDGGVVPLPPAIWLFASALAGLGLIGARRRRRRTPTSF
jgi:hypothetical protein